MSLEEQIQNKLQEASLAGSVCINVDDRQIAVDTDGKKLDDPSSADCTLSLDKETLSGIVDGSVDPMNAYFSGALKIQGDMSIAMSLSSVLKQ
ncbi:MAG: putative sterol carrier protein [Alphaproteobacteria bacterium]|jgi:putative sterol carrier protein